MAPRQVSGTILDANGQPAIGTRVTIRGQGGPVAGGVSLVGDVTATTNAQGRFSVTLAVGNARPYLLVTDDYKFIRFWLPIGSVPAELGTLVAMPDANLLAVSQVVAAEAQQRIAQYGELAVRVALIESATGVVQFPGSVPENYPTDSVNGTLTRLVERKAERIEIAVPDLVLWFNNQLL